MHLLSSSVIASALFSVSLAAPVTQDDSDCTTVICDAKGYDKDMGNLFYDDSGNYSTYEACYNLCISNANCQSFAYGGDECVGLNITLVDNFTPVEDSVYTFFDRACEYESSLAKRTSDKSKRNNDTSSSTCSTVTATTTSSSATSTVSIPSSCTNVAAEVTMTSFKWFNSTHNLDCANPNYPAGSEVCWNTKTNKLCNSGTKDCTCTPFCSTGLPSAAYQPLGYGPPDTISVGINGASSTCSAANAQSNRNFEIGEGHFDCNSAADIMGFYANSNQGQSKTATIYYNDFPNYCNGQLPQYTGSFEIACTYDAGKNATCTINTPVVLLLTGW